MFSSTVDWPGQTEICDFDQAVLVDEDVLRFQIPVYDLGVVDVFEPAQELIDDVLDVHSLQDVGFDYFVQVGANELELQV